MSSAGRDLDALSREAVDAARGLTSGDSALADVLRDLEQERSRAAEAYHAVLRSLTAALEARDGYTGEHSDDVRRLAAAVASRLGLDAHAAGEVEAVALLHDIGKIGIPDGVLHKPGTLTPEEWELMREHPVIGERILRPLPGLDAVATAVRHEHERWDGTGYPDQLGGDTIPLASRIVLACDAWHALVSDRPYRAALTADTARAELERCSGTQFDPQVVEALAAALDAGDLERESAADASDVGEALTEGGGDEHRRRLERELLALIAVAGVVAAAHRIEDVVEIAASRACEAVGAASLSISRWEVQGQVLRTLVNVGDLGPGEERHPEDEIYRLDEYDQLRAIIERGHDWRSSIDDEDIHPRERELLTRLGKAHATGVGIRLGGMPWGELWAARRADQPPFTERDVRFLHTITGLIASAAGRAEIFTRMTELAYEDPLTGVANRRAVEERLEVAMPEAIAAGRDFALLLCDLDGLKELNDAHGHQVGDAALARVADDLREVAGDGLVARIGGDEFCVLLDGCSADHAREMGEALLERLSRPGAGPTLTASCGVASIGLGARKPSELLRAADAAQYTAKRGGRARVAVADSDLDASWKAASDERRAIRGQDHASTTDVGVLLHDAMATLDGPFATRDVLDRLEAVALSVGEAVEATAVSISWLTDAGATIETAFSVDRRTWSSTGRRFGNTGVRYAATDYPESVALMVGSGTTLIETDDESADPAERQILVDYGMTAVLMAGVPDVDSGGWLIEVFADGRTAPLADVETALRLLAREAVSPARPPARSAH